VRSILFCPSYIDTDLSIAVAIHISKNQDIERASNALDNDSVNGNPATFVTYAMIGYGFTSGNAEMEK
jgi:hypothetical protein